MTKVFITIKNNNMERKKELHLFEIYGISSKSWLFRDIIRKFEADILKEDMNGNKLEKSQKTVKEKGSAS